ncbi:hypothetical protein PYJP_07130 [Pyrofollis japonicus]|uniref:hypothetical protein n=1 Tax=Pyrofollis japonicus TaxID=3060460 RepID=UPI00295B5DE2|nr:hypothetical protein [Pyrofollis japonicus]BEP17361.1 hypothetical protein PYJP_07130 [Pyrofollis japonicus]
MVTLTNNKEFNDLDKFREIFSMNVEHVIFSKITDIINKGKRLNGILLAGPRSVGKSYVMSDLASTLLLRNRSIIDCIQEKRRYKKCDNRDIIKIINLIKEHNIIPISLDCAINNNLSLDKINEYLHVFSNYYINDNKFTILLLIDNVHYCYENVRKIIYSKLLGNAVVIAASPTAYLPRSLKNRGLEVVRLYPLRFGEIGLRIIKSICPKIKRLHPLKGTERRKIIEDTQVLFNHLSYLGTKLYEKAKYMPYIRLLFALYAVFGGTIFGFEIIKDIFNQNKYKDFCKNKKSINNKIGRYIKQYISALKRTYDSIVNDAIRVENIDKNYQPYVEASFQVLAASIFSKKANITFSGEDLKRKAIELGDDIALSPLSHHNARSVVESVLKYLREADILFQVTAYRPPIEESSVEKRSDGKKKDNEQKKKKQTPKSRKHKFVYSDPRYLYSAYYGYLLYNPLDSTTDPSSILKDVLEEVIQEIACERDGDNKFVTRGIVGTLLEMITLQNIMLNLYAIRASADKPIGAQPASYGLYTYRLEQNDKIDKNQENEKCNQFEIDALIVKATKKGVRPIYGIEISRSPKKCDELKCQTSFIKDNEEESIKTLLFNIYLVNRHSKTSYIWSEKCNDVDIIYAPIELFLIATH